MIKIHSVKVYNVKDTIKSSGMSYNVFTDDFNSTIITEKDIDRSARLSSKSGGEDKFLRFINVSFVMSASKYFWSEFDTYHFKERNSQGTLYCIKKFNLESCKDLYIDDTIWNRFKDIVNEFNNNPTEENRYILRSSMPEGFVLTSFINTNYNTLKCIYSKRHDHPLREWRVFCDSFIKVLPLSGILNIHPSGDKNINYISNYYDLNNLHVIGI